MPKPTPTPKKTPTPKGKPLGIPIWGWMIAAVLGILIGYTILRKSGGGSSTSFGESGGESPLLTGEENPSGSGGTIATPADLRDLLEALGLLFPSGGGTFGTNSSPESSAETAAVEAANTESMSDPILENLISQGVPIAPSGTMVYDPASGQTYDVSGKPEFSPGNYNPNSPQGVLEMNQALGLGPGSKPVTTPSPNTSIAGAYPGLDMHFVTAMQDHYSTKPKHMSSATPVPTPNNPAPIVPIYTDPATPTVVNPGEAHIAV